MYQSSGATMWRLEMPALSNTLESRSNRAFLPKASRAQALASACSTTCGGTAVASESREQGAIIVLLVKKNRSVVHEVPLPRSGNGKRDGRWPSCERRQTASNG